MTTLEKLQESVMKANGSMYVYTMNEPEVRACLLKAVDLWEKGESFSLFSGFNGRESDSPEEWDYMVKDVFYTLNRVAERKFYTSLTRDQATAFCKALEGDGGHILIGVMDIPASSILFHWGDYHPGEYLDLDPLFEN